MGLCEARENARDLPRRERRRCLAHRRVVRVDARLRRCDHHRRDRKWKRGQARRLYVVHHAAAKLRDFQPTQRGGWKRVSAALGVWHGQIIRRAAKNSKCGAVRGRRRLSYRCTCWDSNRTARLGIRRWRPFRIRMRRRLRPCMSSCRTSGWGRRRASHKGLLFRCSNNR